MRCLVGTLTCFSRCVLVANGVASRIKYDRMGEPVAIMRDCSIGYLYTAGSCVEVRR
jgi:hypothetical protein